MLHIYILARTAIARKQQPKNVTAALIATATVVLCCACAHIASGANQKPDAGSPIANDQDLAWPRSAPIRHIDVKKLYHVRDFGALPDDGVSDTDAITRALSAAIASRVPSEIRFEVGRYDIDNKQLDGIKSLTAEKHMALTISDATDLVIEGNGARFYVTTPLSGLFRLVRCERVIIRHLTIDFDPLPFSAGVIRKVHPDIMAFDLEVMPPHPSLDAPYFSREKGGYGYPIDPAIPGKLRSGVMNVFYTEKVETLGGNLFRVYMRKPTSAADLHYLSPGERWVQIARQNGADLFRVVRSTDITLSAITSYASAGAHYVGVNTDRLNLIKCRALIKDGRWMGGNADGVHMQNCRVGPWIEECEFEGLGDDSFNYYTRPFQIRRLSDTDSRKIKLYPFHVGETRVGDLLRFFEPSSGKIIGQAKVAAVDETAFELELDVAVPNIVPGEDRLATQIYNMSFGQGFVIRKSRFANLRRFGTLIKASNGLIEDNFYEGTSSSAIVVRNEPSWPEGLHGSRLVIRRNRINNCGFDAQHSADKNLAAIAVYGLSANGPVNITDLFSTIEISQNTIAAWRGNGIAMANTSFATIAGNIFSVPLADATGISIRDSANIEVKENVFSDQLDARRRVVSKNVSTETIKPYPNY